MSKSIYKEAIKVVTYLQEQNLHLKDTSGTIYIPTEDIATLENLLIHSHKQGKLLKLYKELATVRNEIISLVSFDAEYDDKEQIEINLENKIKELEND